MDNKQAIEFLEWLLDGLIKFNPHHPLFSHIDVSRVTAAEDKWQGWNEAEIVALAKRDLELPENTPKDDIIATLQNLVNNPNAVDNLAGPVRARLREEDAELISADSPQEKKAKLVTISRRPSRPKYEPGAPVPAGPSPKVPAPPATKAPAEAVGFVDIQAPADVATLKGATEKAFIDEVVQTLRRERPEIEEGASLEQLRETATEVVRQMEAEGKGGADYKINTTAFSRAITDRGRLAEVLVAAPGVTETPPPPLEKKAVYLTPEAPLPAASPETQESVSGLVSQVKANKETFVRDLGQKIEEAHPEFSKQQAQEAAEHIATRLETYEPGKVSEEAAFASVALNPELFERVFPEPEVRGKILDEAVRVSSQRQQEEQIAKQVLPTLIPEAKEAVVDTVYQPTKQRFVPAPEETPGQVLFEPQTIIERVERAPQAGLDLTGTIKASTTTSQPAADATVSRAPVVKEQVYIGVSEKFAPDLEPEVRTRVENLTKSAAADPDGFQSQLKEKLIDSSGFSSNFTSPEQTAAAADAYSKDLTQRLVSLDKGTLASPSLAEIASSTKALDKTFASPIEKQGFVSAVSERGAQIGQMAPVVASALGVEEEVIKAAYQPRPLTVSDSSQEGLATVTTKNLLPAAEEKVPFSEAIVPPAASLSVEGKLPWAKAEGPAQELGVKISYSAAPEALPPKISDLMTTVQKEGYSFNQQSPQDALPLFVFASGVSSAQFQGLIAQAQDKGFGKETSSHLEEFLMRLKALEETRPELFAEFQKLYPPGSVEISFVEYTEAPDAFAFVPSEGTYALGTPNFAGSLSFKPEGVVRGLATKGLNKLTAPAKKEVGQALAKSVAGKALKAGAAKVAAKAGLAQVFSNITAALGSSFGPLGTLIGKALGWIAANLVGKIASFFKKHSKKILGVGLALAGVFVGGWAGLGLMVFGGGVALGALAGVGAPGAGLGALFATFGSFIVSVVLPAIAAPLIFLLLSGPISIAIILFIINSGAYLVPPDPSLIPGAIESPYIDVLKEPSPEGPFENSDLLPLSVTYTITVIAERGSLTNIDFDYQCRVVRRGGQIDCPPPSNITVNGEAYTGPFPPSPPQLISPVENYVLAYTVNYGPAFADSAVSDTFRVVADTDEVVGTESIGSASIVIGDPPIYCPLVGRSADPNLRSYVPGNETRGHGSASYWQDMGSPYCRWGLPQGACYGPNQSSAQSSGNPCYGSSGNSFGPTCSFYGYAIDVFGGANEAVLAPSVGGQSVTWSCSYAFANLRAGHSYRCSSGAHTLILTHLNSGGASGSVTTGEQIGSLFPQGGNTHLHLEYIRNGRYERPEDTFCF